MRRSSAVPLLCALLLPGIVLLPAWRLSGLGAGEDDILYYFPSRVWFAELCARGEPPWLNPWNGLDRPLLADPQSAVFYPATWLFAVLPANVAYPAILWLHYSLALLGTYRLLRGEKLDRRAALVGGIVFAFCGFLLAHRAHFTMQQAAAWTPLVLWRIRRFADEGGAGRLASAALVAALQRLAGHVQIAALTALGSIVYLLARSRPEMRLRVAARWFVAWIAAAGLFAVQLVPTLLYLRECTRTQRTYLDFCENSWWPSSVVGWAMPMLLGQRTPNLFDQAYWGPSHQVEQFSYVGILPLLLAAVTIRAGWRGDPRRRAWVVLFLFALLTALGIFGPACPILYWIPGASIFRVPARAMVLCHLAAAALAAMTLHDLGAALTPQRARLRAALLDWTSRPWRGVLLLVGAPIALVVLALPILPAAYRIEAFCALRPWSAAIWVAILVVLCSVLALRWMALRWDRPRRLIWAAPLVVLDLAIIGWTIDVPQGVSSTTNLLASPVRDEWLKYVRESPGRLWVVTKREPHETPLEYIDPLGKCSSNTNVLDHVESLTDYGPLTPRNFDRVLDFEPWGEPRDPVTLLCDPGWMRRLDVGWLLLCKSELNPPHGATLIATAGADYRLYRYEGSRGRAYFNDAMQLGTIQYEELAPHRFRVRVSELSQGTAEPSRIVVARLDLPGWTATCDGTPLSIESSDGCLLSVRMPKEGAATIEWVYSPPGLWTGAAVTLATTMVLLSALLLSRLRVAFWRDFPRRGARGIIRA